MSPENYTKEQIEDINARVKRAQDSLKDLQLRPACVVNSVNIGDDTFAMKTIVYLQDTKYTPQKSPLQV